MNTAKDTDCPICFGKGTLAIIYTVCDGDKFIETGRDENAKCFKCSGTGQIVACPMPFVKIISGDTK